MYLFICMYMHIFLQEFLCICIQITIYLHKFIFTHSWTHIGIVRQIFNDLYLFICMFIYTYICICVYTHICVHVYIYVYMYIYMYVHSYIHRLTSELPGILVRWNICFVQKSSNLFTNDIVKQPFNLHHPLPSSHMPLLYLSEYTQSLV